MPIPIVSACFLFFSMLLTPSRDMLLIKPTTSHSGTNRSGGSPSQFISSLITHALRSGHIQTHIRTTLLPAYAARYAALNTAITTHLVPLGYSLPLKPAPSSSSSSTITTRVGGYFVWLTLPAPLLAADLVAACARDHALVVAPGGIFAVPDDAAAENFATNIRLCFAWEAPERLEEGVRRIAIATRVLLGDDGKSQPHEQQREGNEGISKGYVLVRKGAAER